MPPGDKPLPPAKSVFISQESDTISSSKIETGIGEMPEDFQEKSADGQTYIAIRCLPDDQGTYAYIGLNINKEISCTSSSICCSCTSSTSKSQTLDNISKITALGEHLSEAQMEDFYKHNIEPKISGDIIQLYQSLHTPQKTASSRQRDGMKFYNKLLRQIDNEITGVEYENDDVIKFLLNRLEQDLKKDPKMKYMFKLTPEQKNLKLLEILRQQVIVRLQKEKRRLLVTQIEEHMLTSSVDSKCCSSYKEKGTESMWELTVTKPLTDNDINKLCDLYPEEVVSTFLDLLIADRQVILQRGKRRQLQMIEKMKSEIDKEIQSDKAIYNKLRETYREWNEILSTIESMMYEAENKIVKNGEILGPKEGILENMIADIKETENLVMEEAHLGEILIEKIIEANMWTFSVQENDKKDESWEIKSAIENMRKQSKMYKLLINKQKRRIKQLHEKLFCCQK
ncbi:PREDICTED: uncharacterized protein LOC107073867 [Polistes dominula]|uniref:Uncharacterized protein LOC107073867 n=1 Tax=Polistes dominula TaxID=743375 RepID=A0ABM1JCI9_POLDO|nr:PREDICTED: uncharacterized protein LOC107073867 [Polistes dominula]